MSETLDVCVREGVCAQLSCLSSLLCLFCGWGSLRVVALPDPERLSARGGGGTQKRARRCGHTRAVSRCTVVSVRCAARHMCTRDTGCVCAREGVCAQLSCPSGLLSFLRMGSLRVVALPDPERLSARTTLFPKGEFNHTRPPQFQPRVSGRMGPEHTLLPSYRESTLTTGLSPLESLESHTQSGGLIHGVT